MKSIFEKSIIFFLSILLCSCSSIWDCDKTYSPEDLKFCEEFIKKNGPGEDAYMALQHLAAPHIRDTDWKNALLVFKNNREYFQNKDKRIDKIIDLLSTPDENLEVKNLGLGINSTWNEYMPVLTADDRTIYFACYGKPNGFGNEDIYVSKYRNGYWQKAENLGENINSDRNEVPLSISADGNTLLFYGTYNDKNGDNFYVNKTSQGFGEYESFPQPINSEFFDSDAFMTSDGKAILFTSDRPNGIGLTKEKSEPFHCNTWGNTDIYVCLKTEEGWSTPINFGPIINTQFAEMTPFLHPDGKTLYFSSDGHYSLGKTDVFKSVRLYEDSWTDWSEPVNLGKEINSADDDFGYKVSTSGDLAYFASNHRLDAFGGWDIYSVTLPKIVKPEPVAIIHGKVTDSIGNILEADIKWDNLENGENVGQLKSDPQDGSYLIILPLGKNYSYYAEKKGYYPISKSINLKNIFIPIDSVENIVLISLQELRDKDVSIRINNIFFDLNKYSLQPESFSELDRLAKFLKQNPNFVFEISAYSDSTGSDEYNLELSAKRAKSVVDYLIFRECSPENLVSKGYGKNNPIESNETEEGRAKNRRVEFRIIKKSK